VLYLFQYQLIYTVTKIQLFYLLCLQKVFKNDERLDIRSLEQQGIAEKVKNIQMPYVQ